MKLLLDHPISGIGIMEFTHAKTCNARDFLCDLCDNVIKGSFYGCRKCDIDICGTCIQNGATQEDIDNTPSFQTNAIDRANDDGYQYWLSEVKYDGYALQNAPYDIRNDETILMAAVENSYNDWALKFATPELRGDKDFILRVVHENCWAIKYATIQLQSDRDVVMAAVRKNGKVLQYASPNIRQAKDVVLASVISNPDAIKHVNDEDLKHDRDVLIAAGMFDENHDDKEIKDNNETTKLVVKKRKKIVLSTRFALDPTSESEATKYTKLFKSNNYIRNNDFKVYAPNAFNKRTCDPNWTRFDWPCRGTKYTCQYNNIVISDTGHPTDDCCWRYSFRYQLQEAKDTGGFMLQLIEKGGGDKYYCRQELGNGQKIERHMAQELNLKVFHVYRPLEKSGYEDSFDIDDIEKAVTTIKSWYDNDDGDDGCGEDDMSECVIRFPRPY